MLEKLSLRDLNLKNKKALIRVDFNVPLSNGRITDDSRIKAAIPTIQYIIDQGASAILMSHLGRPKGRKDPTLSLEPCAKRLSELLVWPVYMAPDSVGTQVKEITEHLKPKEIVLLENLRFHKGEEDEEEAPNFAKDLADLGDVYINDAFGSAHRHHASTTLIAQFFPRQAAMGFLMEKEIFYLGSFLNNPKRPFCAILGGSKISSKFKIIQSLMQKADSLLIGGAMAYTFFKASGLSIGDSLFEKDFLDIARQFLLERRLVHACLLLPQDIVITQKIHLNADQKVININSGIPDGWQGVDVGPKTLCQYAKELEKAATIFWNGPLGVFECPPFNRGTNTIAQLLADKKRTSVTIVGGGDSIAAVKAIGLTDQISHISTGGGASLSYIESGYLPGIDALSDKNAT